uniref:EAL domain-containing protein n=1 Tax=Natronospira sp. TaxID=2024970 RepID=UPI003872EC61
LRHFQFRVEDRHFDVGASIGLVHFSGGEESSAELLRQADLACYAAKESGRNQVRVYDADDQLLRVRHQEIGWFERLRHALKEGRFLLFGQRIIPLNQEGQARREVLLRMRNEEGELILPQDFILTAERYEIMPDLDRWVIDRVLRHLADGLCTGEMLSINLSGLTLDDSELFSFIRQSCRHYGIKGERLAFEITETAAMTHYARANALFRELRQLGCEIHLDDFGSGLSSFGYLRNMQFDCLKIDGSFIRKLDKNPEDRAMVEAMQRIGQTMGMQTVAEFVERPELLAPLREIGIHRAQGFALHRPEPL